MLLPVVSRENLQSILTDESILGRSQEITVSLVMNSLKCTLRNARGIIGTLRALTLIDDESMPNWDEYFNNPQKFLRPKLKELFAETLKEYPDITRLPSRAIEDRLQLDFDISRDRAKLLRRTLDVLYGIAYDKPTDRAVTGSATIQSLSHTEVGNKPEVTITITGLSLSDPNIIALLTKAV